MDSENLAAKLNEALAHLQTPEPASVQFTDEPESMLLNAEVTEPAAARKPASTTHFMRQVWLISMHADMLHYL